MYSKGGGNPEPLNPLAYSMLFSANVVPFSIPVPPNWVVYLISNSMSSLAG